MASYETIQESPNFKKLVSERSSIAKILAILMLLVYFGFILLVAYAKEFLATPLAAGSVTTIGIPIGVGVILAAFVLTGIYVARANSRFDDLTRQIVEESKK